MNNNAASKPGPASLFAYGVILLGCLIIFILFALRQRFDVSRPEAEDPVVHAQELLGLRTTQLTLHYEAAPQEIVLRFPASLNAGRLAGEVQLVRPSDARLNQTLPLSANSTGVQRIEARTLRPGLWRVRVLWKRNGQEYSHEQSVMLDSDEETAKPE